MTAFLGRWNGICAGFAQFAQTGGNARLAVLFIILELSRPRSKFLLFPI
jgi:hypothetical protein